MVTSLFATQSGSGPCIEAKFDETRDCNLVFSEGKLLPRFVLERNNTLANVVIGLNTYIANKARELGLLFLTIKKMAF